MQTALLKGVLLLVMAMAAVNNAAIAQTTSIDRALAIVGEDVITLNEYLTRHRQQQLEEATYPDFKGIVDADLLDAMVNERIQVNEAERRKITVSALEIDRAIDFIAKQNKLTPQELVTQLEGDNFTFEEFRDSIRQQQMIRKLVDAVANARVRVSDQEIENYMKSRDELSSAESDQYEVAHLLVSTSDKTEEAVQREIENMDVIREQIEGGMPFEQAVRDFADSGKDEGGYLGWRTAGQLPELFINALRGMDAETNSLSQVLQSPSGLHLLKLIDKRGGDRMVLQQKIQHILIRPQPEEGDAAALVRANKIYDDLIGGESFESLARLYSADEASAVSGGDLGWINPGQLVPKFEEAAGLLPVNTISQPVRTQYGYHVLRVTDRRNADLATEIAQNRAREAIFRRKSSELFEGWFRAVKERTFVEYVGGKRVLKCLQD